VNSEGDHLSGLTCDVYGDNVVVSSSAAWVEQHREVVQETLKECLGAARVVWRQAAHLKLEGFEEDANGTLVQSDKGAPSEEDAELAEEEDEEEDSPGDPDLEVLVLDAGVKFMVGLMSQKTGFYCDQRDSRKLIQEYSANKRVLDLCCYTGGFALHAAAGGAREVVGVDSSAVAVARAASNADLNQVASVCRFEKADIKAYMHEAIAEGAEKFDIVILDPPKLAPTRNSMNRARSAYRKLNAQAMQLVRPGGLLMTCSCSGAMTQSGEFESIVAEAAVSVGRRMTILRHAGAAPDHTLNPGYPEGKYLTNLLIHVE